MAPTDPVAYPPEFGYQKRRDDLAEIDGAEILQEQLYGEDQNAAFTQRYATSDTYFTWKFIEDVTYG
jgi:hypothetical protein